MERRLGNDACAAIPVLNYGSKRRSAALIWEHFGNPDVYVEPFCGSCAVLVSRPAACPREIVCDLNGYICNFYRALQHDPEAVAYHADWPTIHQDLTARHTWLRKWGAEHREQLTDDPDWYDAKAAGWWVWGISLWIGHGWCKDEINQWDGRPYANDKGGGYGVSAQNTKRPKVQFDGGPGVSEQRKGQWDIRSAVVDNGGRGVSPQRPSDQIPHVGSEIGGNGVSVQRRGVRLEPWFAELSDRLKGVIVLNRDWSSALSPTLLSDTPSAPPKVRGILLDPPYRTEERGKIYDSDYQGASDDAAAVSYAWAVAHGDRLDYRIAYCCHVGDFPLPDGWTSSISTMSGIRRPDRRDRREVIYFSPGCTTQPDLFAA